MSKKYFIPSDSFTEAHNSFPVPDIGWLQTLANSVAEITKRNDDAVTEIKTSRWLVDHLKDFPKSKTTSIWGGIRVIEEDWVPENFAFLYNAKGDAIEMLLYKEGKLYRGEIPRIQFNKEFVERKANE